MKCYNVTLRKDVCMIKEFQAATHADLRNIEELVQVLPRGGLSAVSPFSIFICFFAFVSLIKNGTFGIKSGHQLLLVILMHFYTQVFYF